MRPGKPRSPTSNDPLSAVVTPGDDAVGYVISLNLRRRHSDESQRALAGAKLANVRLGDNQHRTAEGSPIGEAMTQGKAAELLNVGKRSVERAREVLDAGAPELVAAVEHLTSTSDRPFPHIQKRGGFLLRRRSGQLAGLPLTMLKQTQQICGVSRWREV
jgi:hypothetical protein